MPLQKIAWAVTVLICVVAAVVLLVLDYLGYSATVFAVALAAAINLR